MKKGVCCNFLGQTARGQGGLAVMSDHEISVSSGLIGDGVGIRA
jgi:hypothetical protein